jgi:hypothetical protein
MLAIAIRFVGTGHWQRPQIHLHTGQQPRTTLYNGTQPADDLATCMILLLDVSLAVALQPRSDHLILDRGGEPNRIMAVATAVRPLPGVPIVATSTQPRQHFAAGAPCGPDGTTKWTTKRPVAAPWASVSRKG